MAMFIATISLKSVDALYNIIYLNDTYC